MNEKMMVEIRDLLVEIRDLLKGETAETQVPQEAPSEEVNSDILDWLNEKNAEVEETIEETVEETPEVIFQVLDGVDSTGMEDYIGLPVSELPEDIVKMIARPDYIKKFAPMKFPKKVIDALVERGE